MESRHNYNNNFHNQPLENVLNPRSNAPRTTNPDDRVIISQGKYNLDFIDWDNEYEAICSGLEPMNLDEDNPFPGYNIPEGVSEATFAALIDNMQEANEDDGKQGLPKEMLALIKQMTMGKSGKECSVCFSGFKHGDRIRKLPCKHIFHNTCLLPWFEKNSSCPNCRLNLEEFFTKNPTGQHE